MKCNKSICWLKSPEAPPWCQSTVLAHHIALHPFEKQRNVYKSLKLENKSLKPGYEQLSCDSSDDLQPQTVDCTAGIFGVETPGVATFERDQSFQDGYCCNATAAKWQPQFLKMVTAPVAHKGVLVSESSSTLWARKSLLCAVHFHMHLNFTFIVLLVSMATLMSVTSALHLVHSHSLTPVCCFRSWLKNI